MQNSKPPISFFDFIDKQELLLRQPGGLSYLRNEILYDFDTLADGYAYLGALGVKNDSVKAQYESRTNAIADLLRMPKEALSEGEAEEVAKYKKWRRSAFFALSGSISQYRMVAVWLEYCGFAPKVLPIDPTVVKVRDRIFGESSGATIEQFTQTLDQFDGRLRAIEKDNRPRVPAVWKELASQQAQLRRQGQQLDSFLAFTMRQLNAIHGMIVSKDGDDHGLSEIAIEQQRADIHEKYKKKREQIAAIRS